MEDLVSQDALAVFEDEHPQGATSSEVIAFLRRHDIWLTEATFRKYVQLGLLPRSRRVGAKGKHQGSWGVYPSWTPRQVTTIKSLLSCGRTIEEISAGLIGVMADCLGIVTDIRDVKERLGRLDAQGVGEMSALMSEAAVNMQRAADIARRGKDMVEIAI